MTSPLKPWEGNSLQNSTQVRRCAPNIREMPTTARSAPVLPPLPRNSPLVSSSSYNSYMPYSSGYSSLGYGGYGGYGSYGMPYRSSMYGSYGSYGGYNNYSMYGMGGYPSMTANDDAERRFIQYAEESSRNTFASVESIVRAFNSISMMLDNTFFAMTSSFRAVLSVAENFGKLRSMFGHIWYSINIFRLFNWLYRKLMWLMGRKVPNSEVSVAWKQAANGATPGPTPGSSWPTLAFLGVLVSAPYIISKFLPKYEDKCDPATWKSPGVRAKAAFDFIARSPNELSITTNDEVTLAPTYVQEEMNLKNSGWAFALSNGRSGVIPLNYLVINKSVRENNTTEEQIMPVPRVFNSHSNHKTHTKRVSFGENQIFENVDLEDYVSGKKEIKGFDAGKNQDEEKQSEEVKPNLEDKDTQNKDENVSITKVEVESKSTDA